MAAQFRTTQPSPTGRALGARRQSEPVCVVFGTDANFWPQVFVSLYSLVRSNPNRTWRAFVICDAPDATFLSRIPFLRSLGNVADVSLIPISDLDVDFSHAPVTQHLSIATYFRLLIGSALPADVTRALYLDSDTVTIAPIDELIDQQLEGKLLAAIPNHAEAEENARRLGLPPGASYFNAGVLLIDIQKWRTIGAREQLFDLIRAQPEKLDWADQDALNLLFHGDWQRIEERFNYQLVYRPESPEAAIIHYTGRKKPWLKKLAERPSAYQTYLRQTPYAPKRPSRLSIWLRRVGNTARRASSRLVRRPG